MRFGPATASCRVYTFKEGFLSAIAHDLQIEVTRFSIDVVAVATEETAAIDAGGSPGVDIEARFEAGSLRVSDSVAYGQPTGRLSPDDKRTIERNLAEEVLDAARYPEISFSGRAAAAGGDARDVRGVLQMHGRRRDLVFTARRRDGRWRAEVHLLQPDFGIQPFTAMLGTLRVKPEVIVKLALPIEAG